MSLETETITLNNHHTEIQAIYPANSLQQGFIFHAISQPLDDAYIVQTLLDYYHEINIDAYQKAWDHAIKIYPSLRLCFNWEESPIQIITKNGFLHFILHDISNEINKKSMIDKIQQDDRRKGFDLTKPTLMRLHLIKLDNQHYTLLKTEHHAISDAWSASILLNHVHHFYHQFISGIKPNIVQDNAYLQAQTLITKQQTEAQHHWKKVIQDCYVTNDVNTLFTKYANPEQLNRVNNPCELNTDLDLIQYEQLRKLAHDEGITMHGLVQFAWHKILHTYTHDEQTIVGTTISGRSIPIADIEKSVGLYINTLPLIVRWNNTLTVKEQLHLIHQAIMGLNKYSFVYLSSLQHAGNRLFNSLLLFENLFFNSHEHGFDSDLTASNRRGIQKLNYPLALTFVVKNNTLSINFKYDGDYLTHERAHQLLNQFLFILRQIPCRLHSPHYTLDLLTPEEHQKIIHTWNATDADYPDNQTLQDMFEKQVSRTPNAIALIFEEQKLTYRELDTRANQLAFWMHEKGLFPGELVALCLDRSVELLIGILGVLKAGCAYVPIDPTYPLDRIRYVLKDTESRFLLTQSQHATYLQSIIENNIECVYLDQHSYQNTLCKPLLIPRTSNDLAYVIYTSGTTGNPKGVVITHKGIVNRLHWMQQTYPLDENDVVLQKTPYGFDVSVWELFWAHWTGAKIVMAHPEGHKDPQYLQTIIEKEKVTVLHFVPSMLSAFTESINSFKMRTPNSLRYVFCSGEALLANQVAAFYAISSDTVSVHNLYGPTEASIDVTAFPCHRGDENIYIGRPIQNTRVYILTQHLKPVPIGATGELYLSGVGLAREYWHQPELTQAAFIHNPFATESDLVHGYSRLYKTGDRARWETDGNITYLGRTDSQVKIRGFRIELREIEQVMLSYSGVQQAVAFVKEHITDDLSHRFIAAYYVGNVAETLLRQHLARHLPDYMIPTSIMALAHFPVTQNGKLDRKALPLPAFMQDSINEKIEPRTLIEKKLCDIWKKVLCVSHVAITDNFFELGGDSIRSIRLVSCMQEIGFYVSVNDIFKYKTILQLLEKTQNSTLSKKETYNPFSLIDTETKTTLLSENKNNHIEDIYPASYLQMGMLVESLKTDSKGTYHDVFAYTIKRVFDKKLFLSIFKSLTVKHPLLRTAFIEHAEYGYVCVQYAEINIDIHFNVSMEKNISEFIDAEKNRMILINHPGLFSIHILNQTDHDFILVFSFHHAIADGWSVASLISEFTNAYIYKSAITTETIPLYQRVIEQEHFALTSRIHEQFWRDYLSSYKIPRINLALHSDEYLDQQLEMGFVLDDVKSNDILSTAKRLGVSPDTIFLSAYFKTLSRFFNQSDVVIGLVMNNRLEETGGDKVFGLHLNTLPMRLSVGENSTELTTAISQQKIKMNAYKAFPYGKIRTDIMHGNDAYVCAFNYVHFHVADAQADSFNTIHVFEKTTIPLTLHIARQKNSFRIAIKSLHGFIDNNTSNLFFDYLQHDLNAIVQNIQFSWLSENHKKLFLSQNIIFDTEPKIKPQFEMRQPRNALEKSLCEAWKNVLGIKQIGICDDFFDLGGDSIRSIRLVAKMQEIGFHVSVNDIFKHKTILKLVENTNHAIQKDSKTYTPFSLIDEPTRKNIFASNKRGDIEDIYPAGFLQMGMLVESLKTDAFGAYHDVFAYTINRPFNEAFLLFIFKTLCMKHPLLRTAFAQHANYGYVCVQYKDLDISSHFGGIIEENIATFIDTEKNRTFSISEPGLFSVFIANPTENNFILVFSFHHAITDGWSVASLISEFTAAYADGNAIAQENIPQYQRVIAQEREALTSTEFDIFWRDYLENAPLPIRHLVFHPNGRLDQQLEMGFVLDDVKSNDILSTAKRLGVSPDTIFLSAYFKTLSRFFNQSDVVIGLVMNNRLEETGGDKVFGLHLNTLPMRLSVGENSTELTTAISQQKIKMNAYKAFPYGKIRTEIMHGNDAYVCAFNYVHFHVADAQLNSGALSSKQIFEKTTIPFTLHVLRHFDKFHVSIKALNGFIDHDTSRLLLEYFQHDVNAIINGIEFSFLTPDHLQLFRSWKVTSIAQPKDVPVFEMRQPRNALEKSLCDAWKNVLNVSSVGITDNFFELGGDSISSIRLVAFMHEIGFYVSVNDIFKYKTILSLIENTNHSNTLTQEKYLPFSLIDNETQKNIFEINKIGVIEDIYPAGYFQINMLTESLKTTANGAYHDVFAYTINRPFNQAFLIYIFKMLSMKHPMLRTAFTQHVDYGYVCVQYKEIEIASHFGGIIEEKVSTFIDTEKKRMLAVNEPGLFSLFALNPINDQFVLVFSFHHAITDGWSVASLISEFVSAYTEGKSILFDDIPPYQRVIQQERFALASNTHKIFWRDYLADAPSPTYHLVRYQNTSLNQQIEMGCLLDDTKSSYILSCAKRLGVSPDIIFLASYFKALSQLLRQNDLVIGIVMNNRLEEMGGDKVFGLHLNILPLRMMIEETFDNNNAFISALADERVRIALHKAYPYQKLCLDLNKPEGFYACAFNYTHFHINENQMKDKLIQPIYAFEKMLIPLTLQISRYQNVFKLIIRASDQFADEKTINDILDFIQHDLGYAGLGYTESLSNALSSI